jgi:hypothetical protein
VSALVLGKFVYVESWPPKSDDKYGRWLMAVYCPLDLLGATELVGYALGVGPTHADLTCFDLASQLVLEGLGEWRDFG